MAFVNLPPNLQDMFYALSDRIAKLETGPNQAMYTAESAQGSSAQALSVATNAQIQAANAEVTANSAASQATIAQTQATIASTQATAAQVTANGKNKVYYSTSTPGSTANTVGDIWYQYGTSGTYANKVIAQYSGAGGTSWTSVTVSGLVIANIDAGTITTGTLNAIQINAGTGGTAFNVSSTGYMAAQGVWIRGNITADSGTFTGTIQAAAGYFGNFAGGNYWSISGSGITGIGSATITAGAINGSTITGGTVQTSTGSAAVILNGSSNAIQFKTSGSVVGNIVPLSSFGVLMHYGATPDPSGGTFPQMFVGSSNVSISANASNSLGVATTGTTVSGTFDVSGSATFGSATANPFLYLASSGTLRSLYTYGVVRSTGVRTMLIDSSGNFGTAASTRRKKHDIESYKINSNALLQLDVKTFKYNLDIDEDQTVQYGFIAEDAQDLGLNELIQLDSQGIPDYFAYDKLPIFLLQLAQEQDKRIKALEGN